MRLCGPLYCRPYGRVWDAAGGGWPLCRRQKQLLPVPVRLQQKEEGLLEWQLKRPLADRELPGQAALQNRNCRMQEERLRGAASRPIILSDRILSFVDLPARRRRKWKREGEREKRCRKIYRQRSRATGMRGETQLERYRIVPAKRRQR